uniref:non-specific serine/threonine protein kinase n=1 Tax=Cajanus cajan TaxID=3821 RepID=A0A151R4A3_CAJCA|nr:Lectin-domain containing receptor kinase A4.3 [Cajanus cajan]
MVSPILFLFLLFLSLFHQVASNPLLFEGFDENSELIREGASIIKTSRLLKLTNRSTNIVGRAFHNKPFQMLNNTTPLQPYAFSFSTSFVFSIVSPSSGSGGFGLAFTIAPSTQFPGAAAGHFLGLVNSTNDGDSSNHIFAVEFDTVNGYKGDSDSEGNHVGVNVNGMGSKITEPAAYIEEGTDSVKDDFRMAKVDAVQAWIEYDGEKRTLNITVAPLPLQKPSKPLIENYGIELYGVMEENMFAGFSASTGQETSSHYLLGWNSILYNPIDNSFVLNWDQRFNILKGISAGLLYLHEEWEQVVIHRDVKTSNILIDGNLNARLGDFGLARLYNHGQVSHTTNVVGTIGYIAPELTRTGKASTRTDVYAFGVVLLEVAAGKRPVDSDQFFLVEWVIENYHLGQILEVVDPKMNSVYDEEEVELVLKLGLLCTQHRADYRPTMKQVTRYLNFDDPLPEIGDWGDGVSNASSRMSSGFLEVTSSMRTVATSGYLSSISMSTKSIDAGR